MPATTLLALDCYTVDVGTTSTLVAENLASGAANDDAKLGFGFANVTDTQTVYWGRSGADTAGELSDGTPVVLGSKFPWPPLAGEFAVELEPGGRVWMRAASGTQTIAVVKTGRS